MRRHADVARAHTHACRARCFCSPFVVEMRGGESWVDWWEEDLKSREKENCFFYKERNKQSDLGIRSHKNPGEKVSLRLPSRD